jgi:hypothetical protein
MGIYRFSPRLPDLVHVASANPEVAELHRQHSHHAYRISLIRRATVYNVVLPVLDPPHNPMSPARRNRIPISVGWFQNPAPSTVLKTDAVLDFQDQDIPYSATRPGCAPPLPLVIRL